MDYGYDYGYTTTSVNTGLLAGVGAVMIIFYLAIIAFSIVVMWKIFKKAGKEGWIALIPFYNLYTLFEITWGNGWLFLLTFLSIIPFIGSIAVLVIAILTNIKLAKAFGKSGGFAVGLIFLSLIFMAILAFDNSEYVGVEGKTASAPNTVPNIEPQQVAPTTPVEPVAPAEPVAPTETVEEQPNDLSNQ